MPTDETSRDDIWQVFHSYQNLADVGAVRPLTCPDCGGRLVTQLYKNDLGLWCPACDHYLVPGLTLIDQVYAVVREHYII